MASVPAPLPRRAVVLAACGVTAGLVAPRSAQAASQITPTLLDFAPGQMAGLLEIDNQGDSPLPIDAEVMAWTQQGDRDIEAPSDDIVVSPPAAVIPVAGRQTLRVILRRQPPGDGERSYRLLITENPQAGTPNRSIAVSIVHSVPVFAGPPALGEGRAQWRAERRDGGFDLVVSNAGLRYIRFSALSVATSRAQFVPVKPVGQTPYALPGAERRWRMSAVPPGIDSVMLRGVTQFGPFEQTVPLGR